MQTKTIAQTATLLGATAVLLGALGAHTLKNKLTPEQLSSFETGVKYQFYHAVTLLIVYTIAKQNFSKGLRTAYQLFTIGVILFSCSIYLLSTRSLFGVPEGLKFLGPITPLGGVLMIAGWITLFFTFTKQNDNL